MDILPNVAGMEKCPSGLKHTFFFQCNFSDFDGDSSLTLVSDNYLQKIHSKQGLNLKVNSAPESSLRN